MCLDFFNRPCRFLYGSKRQNALAGGQNAIETCILQYHWLSRSEVTGRSATEPAGFSGNVALLRNAPLALGALDVRAVGVEITTCLCCIDDLPTRILQDLGYGSRSAGTPVFCGVVRLPFEMDVMAQGDLEHRRGDTVRKIEILAELHVLLPKKSTGMNQRLVARPTHDCRENLP